MQHSLRWRRLVMALGSALGLSACGEGSSVGRVAPSAVPQVTAVGSTSPSGSLATSSGGSGRSPGAGGVSGSAGGASEPGSSGASSGAGGTGPVAGDSGGAGVGSDFAPSGGGAGVGTTPDGTAPGTTGPEQTVPDATTPGDGSGFDSTDTADDTTTTGEPDSPTDAASTDGGVRHPPFILGADVSIVLQDEYWGATFTDQGEQGDVFEILARHGFNYARLRTFVNPAAPGGYADGEPEAWCDIAHTEQLAVRAKAAGLGVLLDFHYSDTWADPVAQHAPAAWASFDIEQLEQAVYDYTFESVARLRDAGALPEMVQVGNEITNGIAGVSRSNLEHFARVLKAGGRAVRDVDPEIWVMLHIERCHDLTTSRAWLNDVLGQGVEFDVFAQSCYGDATGQDGEFISGYHGDAGDWERTLNALANEYPELRFAVAEYSADKRALNDIVYNLPNGAGVGTFLWDTTRWYATHPIEPVFTTGSEWNDFISIPSLMALYEQMAEDYGLR